MKTLKQRGETCEGGESVSVGMTEGRGRGLFAARAMKAGVAVLIERPLVGMQSLDNARDVTVCRNCLGFAGDVISQLEVSSGVPRHECLERYRRRRRKPACGNESAPEAERPGQLSGLCECLEGCGEVYCSAECRSEHWDRSHRLLCVGPIPEEGAEDHPLVAFRVHAVQTNEIFLLVGEVLAQIAAAFFKDPPRTRTGDAPDAVDADNLAAARAPFADFVQEPWWDVAVARDCTNPEDAVDTATAAAASLPATLRVLCEESSALLRSAFALALGPLPAPLALSLSAERFARVVGMFEQNNVGVRAPSPIPGVVWELLAEGEGGGVVDGPAHHGAARREVLREAAGLVLEIMGEEDDCEDGGEDEDAGDVANCCGSTDGGERVAGAAAETGSAAAAAKGGYANGDKGAAGVVSGCCGRHEEGAKGDDDGRGCCAFTANGGGARCGEKDVEPAGKTHSTATAAAPTAVAVARGTDEFADAGEGYVVAVLRSAVNDDGDGDDKDGPREGLFVPLDGTALYSLVCCMNHSCRPNCVVRYPGRRQQEGGKESGGRDGGRVADPLVAEVVLLEDVPAGEELTQSYVTREMGLTERRKALEDYGFLCACPRCLEEEEQAAAVPSTYQYLA